MPDSPFAALEAQAHAAVDAVMSEPVVIQAFVSSNYARSADPSRADQTARVTHFLASDIGSATGSSRGNSESRKIFTGATAMISARQLAALAWIPRQGDRLIFHPDSDNPRAFRVDAVMAMDGGDAELQMSEESHA